MKALKSGIALSLLCAFILSSPATAQSPGQDYYVTIGVFAVHNNAIRYTAKANKAGFSAQYAVNPRRNLYYVYLLQSDDRRKAASFMIKVRAESEYKDAWIFQGRLGAETKEEKPVEPIVVPVVPDKQPEPVPVEVAPMVIVPEKKDSVIAAPPTPPVKKRVVKGKLFTFKFLNAENGNEVRGEVHFAESKKATQYQAFKADSVIDLPAPRNAEGIYFVTTVAPGYKSLTTEFHFKDPLPVSSGTGAEGDLIIPMSLERAKRGDYIEFNNVTFYRNSVLMHPEAQLELDGLVDLMKEHTSYKIRIHGHCNGTEDRDVTLLGKSAKLFEADPGNTRQKVSDTELTEYRAENVRRYLVSQRIDTERIKTKGEGGKMMVYPQNSVYANYNDRIEIEVTKH